MTIFLDYDTDDNIVSAARFIAELVRQGLRFNVRQQGDLLEINLTGGF